MENFIKLDTTIEMGVTNLGKYTLPKIPALVKKVFDVFVRQSEK
jgi:hypothetical protein